MGEKSELMLTKAEKAFMQQQEKLVCILFLNILVNCLFYLY